MGARKKRVSLYVLAALAAGALASLFLMVGPPQLLAESEKPEFCAGCHVMAGEYEAWLHAGAHRRAKCVECHLPNQSVAAHYVWKTIDGMKDTIAFYSGRVEERIAITAHGQEVIQANCIRCHETTVEQIDQERLCWDCHRRLAHRRSGQIQTL